ncbi:MAG: hypothetical protein MI785_10450 [Kiloniellales bacterium]|nr:hypothetical protein [Kiloniellales bacterium]
MQALKTLVIGMGVLIVIGFVLLVVGLANKFAQGGKAGFGDVEVAVPDGCTVAETLAEGDRLLLRLEGPAARGCAQVMVIDLESGAVQGRLRLAPGAAVPVE